ncbi:MAG: indolepyruvate oxidoreductase subunit beta [Sulfolobales archaeon]
MRELNILVTGIGGQGQLFLSRIIGEIFLKNNIPAYIAETHGLSQRGGTVVVHVRVGREIRSPLIPIGEAHIMISLELIEASRYVYYLRSDGVAIINNKMIPPPGKRVNLDPQQLIDYIRSRVKHVYILNASKTALEYKMPISANIYMIGGLIKLLDRLEIVSEDLSDIIIKDLLPSRGKEINLLIYESGKKEMDSLLSPEEISDLMKIISR